MSEAGRMLTTVTNMVRGAGQAAGLLAVISVLIVAIAGPADAQRTTTKEVVEAYNKAQEMIGEDPPRYREARDLIASTLSGNRTKDERAVLLRFKAQLEVELDNFPQAIRDIEASNATGVLDDVEKAENYYFLGRLYLGVEPPNYAKAIENLRRFIQVAENPEPDAYFYLGQALALMGNFREAITNAQKAIELSKQPKENHYRLLLFSYSELENYQRVVSLVERMLTLFNIKDEYLSQLAAGYQELGRDRDAFLVQAFRHELGFLDTEGELVGIAELYLTYENPYRGARILEKEMNAGRVSRDKENLEKLGNMWFLAREYKEARKYLSAAASRANTGELDFRIAQTYFEDENWDRAETHFRRALNKGSLKEPCQARVLLAHTLNSKDNPDAALEQFRIAARSKACETEALQWVEYLELQAIIKQKTENFQLMTDVIEERKKAGIAVSDDENVHAIAEEALEAAQAALDADSGQIRQRKLSEYERARDSARRRLNAGALDEAKKDLESVNAVIQRARQANLTEDEQNMVGQLEKMANRRVKALEEAQGDLEKAAEVAKQARAKN
ncbi:MAG: tetratricopeptide repeat protein [Alphaproteobacteria bacterium]